MGALAMFAAVALAAAPASAVEGHWLHPHHSVIVRVAPCGGALCGTVTWANDAAKKAARRSVNQLVGTQLLSGVKPESNGQWKTRIFVPDLNIRVGGRIEPLDARRLKVSGCLIASVFCGEQVWTRIDGPVPTAD